jgi:hypothetical protein
MFILVPNRLDRSSSKKVELRLHQALTKGRMLQNVERQAKEPMRVVVWSNESSQVPRRL